MSILDLIIIIPIIGAIAVFVMPVPRVAALGAAGLNLALVLYAALSFQSAEAVDGFKFTASRLLLESPELSFAVGVDGMSMVLVLLTGIVTLCAVWASPAKQGPLYYASSLLIAAGALGAFCSTDLFFFYAFH